MAMTTLCPNCKAVCTIPESALGVQVACSRCQSIFTAELYDGPKHLCAKPVARRGLRALTIFFLLLAVSGTVAMVVASFVFLAYQLQNARHPHESDHGRIGGGNGGGFGFGPPMPFDPEVEGNANSQKLPTSALTFLPAPPKFAVPAATQAPANLSWRPNVGEYVVTVHTWLQGQEQSPDGSVALVKSRTLAELTETIQAVDPSEQASIRLRFRGYLADASRDGASRTMPLATVNDLAPAAGFILLNEKGAPTANRIDVARVAPGTEGPIKKIFDNQRLLFEFCAVSMPNLAAAKPGTEWSYQRPLTLQYSDEESSSQVLEATAKFRGVQRSGSDEFALVELKGKFKGSDKGEDKEGRGWALISTATGMVMEAQAELPFAFALPTGQTSRQVNGIFNLSMQRQIPRAIDEND
jgi:hypothetical protein